VEDATTLSWSSAAVSEWVPLFTFCSNSWGSRYFAGQLCYLLFFFFMKFATITTVQENTYSRKWWKTTSNTSGALRVYRYGWLWLLNFSNACLELVQGDWARKC